MRPTTVTSRDGTAIAYERAGTGPPLVLVEAAGHYRAFSSFDGLMPVLANDFTVYRYDRRGRGDSGDTAPFAVEREVDDLAALVAHAGGSAFLYGYSSGGLVAVHAAAGGLPVAGLALFEPPIDDGGPDNPQQAAFTARLAELVGAGRRGAAVEHFLAGVGLPDDMLAQMRGTPPWAAMEAVAPTLVYDSLVSAATTNRLLASVTVPTLVLSSAASGEELTAMATGVATALPDATHRVLPGEWHGVADDVLAAALREFFAP
jgi:pimeloyl-ACP methyl ester carboxylesterase